MFEELNDKTLMDIEGGRNYIGLFCGGGLFCLGAYYAYWTGDISLMFDGACMFGESW